MKRPSRLPVLGTLGAQIAFALMAMALAGMVCVFVFMQYRISFSDHLNSAELAGIDLFSRLEAAPDGLEGQVGPFSVSGVEPERVTETPGSVLLRFPGIAAGAQEVRLSLLSPAPGALFGERVNIRLFGSRTPIALSTLSSTGEAGLARQFGALVRALADYCSDTIVYVQREGGQWQRIAGPEVWGCSVQPADYRVPALIVFGILMIALIGFSGEVSSRLKRLAEQLGNRANQPRTSPITIEGPAEIRAVAEAANAFLAGEREGLEQRATLLSGMSHDLGTPATRLRLRSALVADPELRHKLEADIDQMTQMIEGVLAYTRNEMDEEEPRQVSVLALVESLADDYADTGQPVRLTPFEGVSIRSSPSIFSSGGPEHGHVAHERFRLVCLCRPNALRRALTNLIDNALKYGKSATLSLSADADTVTIHVDDEGSTLAEGDLDALTAPFERGPNAAGKPGAGLGLTIVGSVARIHGGSLGFERLATGHRASLTIRRR